MIPALFYDTPTVLGEIVYAEIASERGEERLAPEIFIGRYRLGTDK
jgi:hypothetical protein